MEDQKPVLGKRSEHWPAVRAVWLHTHNTCCACGGTENLEVHHKRPFHLHPELELDPHNFITLCEKPSTNCHYVFGHAGNWHGYVVEVEVDSATHLTRVKASDALGAKKGGDPIITPILGIRKVRPS